MLEITENDIDIIQKQTGVSDVDLIKRTFEAMKSDVVKTIMTLSSIVECPAKCKNITTEFEEVRKIVDEKENLYFQMKK